MSPRSDHDPHGQRTRDDRPRYRDDNDDDYRDSRKVHRPRYDGPPDSVPSNRPPREIRPDPQLTSRKAALPDSDSDDDPRGDKHGRPAPQAGGRRSGPAFVNDPAAHDLENKTSRANKSFRGKRDDLEDEEADMLRGKRQDMGPPRRRSFDDDNDELAGPRHGRRGEADLDQRRGKSHGEPAERDRRERGKDLWDEAVLPRRRSGDRREYDEPEPPRPRRRETDGVRDSDRDRERRRRDKRYDDDDEYTKPRRRPDDDRHDDRGYRSDGRPRRRERDDGYASDHGVRRQKSGQEKGRDIWDEAVPSSRRDKHGDRDRDRHDSDRERDHKKKGLTFSVKDIGRYVETGQKHYKTVAPIVNSLAKMYMDSQKK